MNNMVYGISTVGCSIARMPGGGVSNLISLVITVVEQGRDVLVLFTVQVLLRYNTGYNNMRVILYINHH